MKTTLKNGLVVANFSSNHAKHNGNDIAFKFEDGSELKNVSIEQMKRLSLEVGNKKQKSACGRFFETKKVFELTDVILSEIKSL